MNLNKTDNINIEIKDKNNKNRIEYTYKINDLVLMKNNNRKNKLDDIYLGPYTITHIEKNYITIRDVDNMEIKMF